MSITPAPATTRARWRRRSFPDNVPVKVYDNLVKSVRRGLPGLYRFYKLRRKLMKLPDIHQYDVYVPILSDLQKTTPWPDAVEAGDRFAGAAWAMSTAARCTMD